MIERYVAVIYAAHFVEKGREAARAALMIARTRARVAA